MGSGTVSKKALPRVPLRHGEGGKDHLTSLQGLAALSLDALSSVAYGPEAIVLVLAAAGTSALGLTLPVTLAIAGLLAVLVVSYCQVIAVVDYVLTVAVSLATGLILITAVNLWGIAESARVLMLPMVVFLASIFGVIIAGLLRSHPAAVVGTAQPARISEAIGVILILKAFSAGCSALTGIEAIANGVPAFRTPRARRAQRTELMLGALLGTMLIGLSVLIRREHIAPRGGVTVLAQLTAGSFGTGWAYYAVNIAVTLVLALAANTSFGGLPVLTSLLSDDDRLPHLLGLRAERPVHRYGVITLAVLAGVMLIAVNGDTARLIPLDAIGVFIGFTISQTGMVRHWHGQRSPRWRLRAALNGTGAVLTATAAAVFVVSKFTSGAWVVVLVVPALMLLFARIQSYYKAVGLELGLGRIPDRPRAALPLGDDVVAVSVHPEVAQGAAFRADWDRWNPGVRLETLDSPHRSLVHPVVDYVRQAQRGGEQVAVLITEVQPGRWRYRILQNQRGLLLATVLRASTDVVICTIPYRLTTR